MSNIMNNNAMNTACNCSSTQDHSMDECVDSILATFQNKAEELIPILQQVQHEYGYIPDRAIHKVARYLRLSEITVYGVATFYAQFKLIPMGRNVVKVCRGTACHVRGTEKILDHLEKELHTRPGETSTDGEYSLETVACFGACALAPVMVVNDTVYGKMTTQKVSNILKGDDQVHPANVEPGN